MNVWRQFVLVLGAIFLVSFFCGCGGGSSSGTPSPGSYTVSGVASKGPIEGGTISIQAINSDGSVGESLGSATSLADGSFNVDIGSYTGNVLVTVTGGTYTDEATGSTVTNTALSAAANVSGNVEVAVTPLTDVAVQVAGTLTAANIESANALVSAMVGFDIIQTQPTDALDATVAGAASTEEIDYALVLAGISMMVNTGDSTVDDATVAISGDLADAQLDTVGADLGVAIEQFIASEYNQTIVTDSTETTIDDYIADATTSVIGEDGSGDAALSGTYRLANMGIEVENGHKWAEVGGYNGDYTITFDEAGGCSISGPEYSIGNYMVVEIDAETEEEYFDADTRFESRGTFNPSSCSYSLAADGTVVLDMGSQGSETFFVSVDGNTITSSGSDVEGGSADANILIGVKKSSVGGTSILNGTYYLGSFGLEIESGTIHWSEFGAFAGEYTATFDGQGGCSLTGPEYSLGTYTQLGFDEDDFAVLDPSTSGEARGIFSPSSCSYTVSAGVLSMNLGSEGTLSATVSADGETLLDIDQSSELEPGATSADISLVMGIKLPSGASAASLNGSFNFGTLGVELQSGSGWSDIGGFSGDFSATFDGQGGCTFSGPEYTFSTSMNIGYEEYYDENNLHKIIPFLDASTSRVYEGIFTPSSCTYTLSSSGALTMTMGADTLTAMVSSDGNSIVTIDSDSSAYEADANIVVGVKLP